MAVILIGANYQDFYWFHTTFRHIPMMKTPIHYRLELRINMGIIKMG